MLEQTEILISKKFGIKIHYYSEIQVRLNLSANEVPVISDFN